jgi:hypothetical protein
MDKRYKWFSTAEKLEAYTVHTLTKPAHDLNELVNCIKLMTEYMYDYRGLVNIKTPLLYKIIAQSNLWKKDYVDHVLIPKFNNIVDKIPIPEWTPRKFTEEEIQNEIRVIKKAQSDIRLTGTARNRPRDIEAEEFDEFESMVEQYEREREE